MNSQYWPPNLYFNLRWTANTDHPAGDLKTKFYTLSLSLSLSVSPALSTLNGQYWPPNWCFKLHWTANTDHPTYAFNLRWTANTDHPAGALKNVILHTLSLSQSLLLNLSHSLPLSLTLSLSHSRTLSLSLPLSFLDVWELLKNLTDSVNLTDEAEQ